MILKIITVGRKNPNDYQSIIDEYQKRLVSTQKLEWEFIPPSSYDEHKARSVESTQILQRLKPNDTVWLLDERGEQISSPTLASKVNVLKNQSVQRLVIIIGGAYGVNEDLRSKASWQWSLSEMVFPHQLVRLILIEQLYRAQQISNGTSYHHA